MMIRIDIERDVKRSPEYRARVTDKKDSFCPCRAMSKEKWRKYVKAAPGYVNRYVQWYIDDEDDPFHVPGTQLRTSHSRTAGWYRFRSFTGWFCYAVSTTREWQWK